MDPNCQGWGDTPRKGFGLAGSCGVGSGAPAGRMPLVRGVALPQPVRVPADPGPDLRHDHVLPGGEGRHLLFLGRPLPATASCHQMPPTGTRPRPTAAPASGPVGAPGTPGQAAELHDRGAAECWPRGLGASDALYFSHPRVLQSSAFPRPKTRAGQGLGHTQAGRGGGPPAGPGAWAGLEPVVHIPQGPGLLVRLIKCVGSSPVFVPALTPRGLVPGHTRGHGPLSSVGLVPGGVPGHRPGRGTCSLQDSRKHLH